MKVKVFLTLLHCKKKQNEMYERDKRRRQRIPLLFVLYRTRVYFLMLGQVIMAYEGFPTFVTLVALVVMVDSEVESVQGINYSLVEKQGALQSHSSNLSGPTCRSCRDGNFGHRCCRGEASPRCGSSGALSRLSYKKEKTHFFQLSMSK